jgi:hypothetical protein
MKRIEALIGWLVVVVAVVAAPSFAHAQGHDVRKVERDGKGGAEVDFAAARADAHAKANNRASQDVDVKNKLNQKQAAVGVGVGGKSNVDVKNTNTNTLKTGDITNYNANLNENKQINHQTQSFGLLPLRRELVAPR